MFGDNVIRKLNQIINSARVDINQMLDFEEHMALAEVQYNNLPNSEKNNICVNLAKRMGCPSDDVAVCRQYIRTETFG